MTSEPAYRRVGRYVLGPPIASGGMGTVHLGRLHNLSRVVAIKQLQTTCAHDPSLVSMFHDEILLLSRIRHKNVVAPIEFLEEGGEFFIVMEYVEGESLSRLARTTNAPFPPGLASKIIGDVLVGLHAAHEAVDPNGLPLGIVHRDVSPQNIMVGVDGAARILDFGIAKAAVRAQVTEVGQLKGKPHYMAPEQLAFEATDTRTDLFGTGVVLWELLTGCSLFGAKLNPALLRIHDDILTPSSIVPDLPPALDALVMQALARCPVDRFSNAREMADALMNAVPPWRDVEVGDWVRDTAREALEQRGDEIQDIETAGVSLLTRRVPLLAPARSGAELTNHLPNSNADEQPPCLTPGRSEKPVMRSTGVTRTRQRAPIDVVLRAAGLLLPLLIGLGWVAQRRGYIEWRSVGLGGAGTEASHGLGPAGAPGAAVLRASAVLPTLPIDAPLSSARGSDAPLAPAANVTPAASVGSREPQPNQPSLRTPPSSPSPIVKRTSNSHVSREPTVPHQTPSSAIAQPVAPSFTPARPTPNPVERAGSRLETYDPLRDDRRH